MNRNANNHFRNVPEIDIKRSKFFIPHTHKTTFDSGKLIPIFRMEVMSGDSIEIDMSAAMRMATPIFPVMDNRWADVYFFYTPFRLLWTHYKEFLGENKLTAWEQPVEYEIPQIEPPEGGWTAGTIADYMGFPTNVDNYSASHLYFRAYCEIWNNWFRDQNLKDAAMINYDETTLTGANSGDYVINAQLGAEPLPVARYHSYFTSALPNAQKGTPVYMPLGSLAPVGAMNESHTFGERSVTYNTTNNTEIPGTAGAYTPIMYTTNERDKAAILYHVSTIDNTQDSITLKPNNLYADLAKAQGATLDMLYMAYGVQRMLYRDAIMGTRYREIIRGKYGVTLSDARALIPEYLGGNRYSINIDQVIQTSNTNDVSPQGNTAAYSLTNFKDSVFTKSFEEPGIIIGLICVRTEETYQQGLEKMFTRKTKYDFYDPMLANIGEQPIYNKEIYLQGNAADEEVFGYQEAWADYRYMPNRVSGAFRSNYQGTLDSWHYANNFNEQPTLSSEFIDANPSNIERTIAVQSEPQFIADFYFKINATRPMPVYSVPGLQPHM